MSRRHKRNPAHVDPDLPITPMLDMAFQLLAFFVMTFNPTPAEGHLDMALPKIEGGESSLAPPPVLEDEAEELVVSVDANDRGEIAMIKLSSKQDTTERPLGSDTQNLWNALKDKLKENGKASKVKLQMAENLSYKLVVKLMDEISRAGFKQVAPALLHPGTGKRP